MKKIIILAAAGIVLGTSHQAVALVANRSDTPIEFSFANPGARASAMGGAFIGVADDATAAYTNPAGLTILTEPEFSFEFNSTTSTYSHYLEDGTKFDDDDTRSGVSFLSFAKPSKNITLTVFRHELINMHDETDHITPYDFGGSYTWNLNSELDLKATTYGMGVGLKLHERVSIGFSFGFAQLDYDYLVSATEQTGLLGSRNYNVVHDSDQATQYGVAMLINPFGDLNIGLSYLYGPEFQTLYSDELNGMKLKNTINVPDIYGAGISYRLFNSLTLACDVRRINYSDLLDDFYYYDDSYNSGLEKYLRWQKNNGKFAVDDVTEVSAGVEYVIDLGQTPLALRAGYAHRPAHNIHDVASGIAYYQKTRLEGEDEDVISGGLGIVINEQVQMDLAAAIGDLSDEYNLSFVYRFK